jgi:hypothetical protein
LAVAVRAEVVAMLMEIKATILFFTPLHLLVGVVGVVPFQVQQAVAGLAAVQQEPLV